jgi:hypothetical protein
MGWKRSEGFNGGMDACRTERYHGNRGIIFNYKFLI